MIDLRSLDNADVYIAFFNFVTSIANIVWSFQNRMTGNDKQTIMDLKKVLSDKEDLIQETEKDKERWKTQYHSLFKKFNHLEGRVKVYETMPGSKSEAQGQPKTIST